MVSPQTKFEEVSRLRIRYRGLYDWNALLQASRKWLRSEHCLFFEPKHKYRPDEQEVELKGFMKVNEYVKYQYDIQFKTFDVKEVEVIKEGKKLKMSEGKILIDMWGTIELDWQQRFQGNKFLQYLQDFLHKYILKQQIGMMWYGRVEQKLNDLNKTLRDQLEMEA